MPWSTNDTFAEVIKVTDISNKLRKLISKDGNHNRDSRSLVDIRTGAFQTQVRRVTRCVNLLGH